MKRHHAVIHGVEFTFFGSKTNTLQSVTEMNFEKRFKIETKNPNFARIDVHLVRFAHSL